MSEVELRLSSPPGIHFVLGYPGIPTGTPDKPGASVRGIVEVRVPQQGVEAKWVRIELRKVETLPGGREANTFYDLIGPSPVNLWHSSDEYTLLRSHNFSFSIPIPESVPPSMALKNLAGINYELMASLCFKYKSFLQKAKSVVESATVTIAIDKHELHSSWPLYRQPEMRQVARQGINLIVQRDRTCYGPGDRISVHVTVKSDKLNAVFVREFEISLRESIVFRGDRGKIVQTEVGSLCEGKLAVNQMLYGDIQHRAELSCQLSNNHTTTTVNSARHIDITHTLCIKVLMDSRSHLTMDLPAIVTNWPSCMSAEAIRTSPKSVPCFGVGGAYPARVDIQRVWTENNPTSMTMRMFLDGSICVDLGHRDWSI